MSETIIKHLAQPADGSKVEYSTTGTTFIEVNELRSLQYPRKMRGKVPGSTLYTAGRFKRKLKGWKDSDDLEVKLAATAVMLAALDTLYEDSGPDLFWRLTYPNAVDLTYGGNWTFKGWLSRLEVGEVTVETDELVEVTFNIVVNSVAVFSPTAPTLLMAPEREAGT